MIRGFIPLFDRAGGNPPFWTLAREEYLYLMYFLILAWRKRFSLLTGMIGVIALSVVSGFLFDKIGAGSSELSVTLKTSALTLWIQWYLGAVAAESIPGADHSAENRFRPCSRPSWRLGVVLRKVPLSAGPFSASLGAFFRPAEFLRYRYEKSGRWENLSIPARSRGSAKSSLFSYSLYLIHNPVRGLLKGLLGPLSVPHSAVQFTSRPLARARGLGRPPALRLCGVSVFSYAFPAISVRRLRRKTMSARSNRTRWLSPV